MYFKQRTKMAGQFRSADIGETVVVNGWVDGNRDLGGLLFFDVRDRSGKVQCVVQPTEETQLIYEDAKQLRAEFVVSAQGVVRRRERENPKMLTGEIEIVITSLTVLSESEVPPFEIKEEITANEDLRLRYRYLDLRRQGLAKNLVTRHKITQTIRKYFDERGFLEIETPMLMKATPEGARDFLVPSRLHAGEFYALPQSPQLYKQILMIAGLDKYFQIVKCFRDEDLRADRQPEFTQLDVEMSFPNEEIVYEVMENCLHAVWQELGLTLPKFQRITYKDAMMFYGSDKPDLRYTLKIATLTELLRGKTEFKVFSDILEKPRGVIGCVVAPGAGEWSRKQLDTLTDLAKIYGAGGLVWMKVTTDGFDSSAKKFLSEEVLREIANASNAKTGDLVLIVTHGNWERAYTILGALRSELAKRLGYLEGKTFEFAPTWITNMPMFEYDEAEAQFVPKHHPFTSPDLEEWKRRDEGLENVFARAYDIVINGYELGSGSIRIHDRTLQNEVFDMLKLTEKEKADKFGFMLEAFQYGAPPHGGMALGIDRIAMLCCGTENIRDVIAFPKTTSMQSLMDSAPSPADERQLKELHLMIRQK
jgi:aspartyl-tRNA synthetase